MPAPSAPPTALPLVDRFAQVRGLTDTLTSRLSAEDQTPQSMEDASPTKWHRAHTTWFFEEFVLRGRPDYSEFDPTFRYLFNSYYEAIGPRHPRPYRGLVTRPGVAEIGQGLRPNSSAIAAGPNASAPNAWARHAGSRRPAPLASPRERARIVSSALMPGSLE